MCVQCFGWCFAHRGVYKSELSLGSSHPISFGSVLQCTGTHFLILRNDYYMIFGKRQKKKKKTSCGKPPFRNHPHLRARTRSCEKRCPTLPGLSPEPLSALLTPPSPSPPFCLQSYLSIFPSIPFVPGACGYLPVLILAQSFLGVPSSHLGLPSVTLWALQPPSGRALQPVHFLSTDSHGQNLEPIPQSPCIPISYFTHKYYQSFCSFTFKSFLPPSQIHFLQLLSWHACSFVFCF